MQALRKFGPQERAAVGAAPQLDRYGPWLAGEEAAAASPALALREHLAVRLEELARGDAAVLAEPLSARLPVPVRLAVIVGLSLSLWLALYLAVAAII